MKKGVIVAIVVVVLVLAGAAYWYTSMQSSAPVAAGPTSAEVTPTTTGATGTSTPSSSPILPAVALPAPVSAVTVAYNNTGFLPETVVVAQGGTVTFTNNSGSGVWVASDPHPTHTGYPTTGGCIGSTFDSCKSIPPGGSWSFTFTYIGNWGYHNHVDPAQHGVVVVQK